MSAGGSSYITEGAHHAWLLSANRDTLADPPQTVNHTWTIAGPSAHRHMNTWARLVSWRSCFREVNCVTVGGDTSVAERPLVGSWQTPRLLFHISINTTTSKESWLARETPAILVNSCKWKTSISGIGFLIWYQFFAAIKLQTLEWPWRGTSEASQFRSEMAQNGNILNHTPVFLCFSVGSRFIGVERGQDESMNDALLSLAHNMPAHVQTWESLGDFFFSLDAHVYVCIKAT